MTRDQLTNEVTAFRTWSYLIEKLEAGWVPTLAHSGMAKELGLAIEEAGYQVFWRE